MGYKRRDNYYIVDIIEKAIKTLNDKKGNQVQIDEYDVRRRGRRQAWDRMAFG